MLGETLMTIPYLNAEPETELDITTFPKGTYFIELATKNGNQTTKVIKE